MGISEENTRRIYTSLLKQAPPGEFNAVFDDIRNLHENTVLLDEQTDTTLVEYNHDNFLPVYYDEFPKSTILTKYNVVDQEESVYLEPNSNKLFTWDAIQRVVLNTQESNLTFDPELVAWRAVIQKELDGYIADHFFKHGIGAAFIHDGAVIICISSHKYMRRNCYAGRWCSKWEVPLFKKSSQVALNGHASVLTHYYEDGNVQMNSTKNFVLNVAYGNDITAAAKEVLKSITEAENLWSVSMFEKFNNFSEKTFKLLRRALPVTRTKMDWIKAHSYRMAKDLAATAPQ
uniref:F-actin-capping protein subunit alpha n=1 Tax=Panagrellus redivivus TaxID=6233 RepID=A0A7E4W627_PANRE